MRSRPGRRGRACRAPRARQPLQFDDPINIQFTSGTTGAPKGATLTHHNILNNGYFVGEAHAADAERDRVCIPVPLYHCFGMVLGNLACITHGATMVYPGEGFDPLATLADGRRPSAARRSTACRPCSSPSWTIPSSRASISPPCAPASWPGAPCPIEVMRRCVDEMHMREVTIAYGMTETSPVSFQSALRRPARAARLAPSAASTRISRSRSSTPRAASCRAARRASCARAATPSCSATGTMPSAPRRRSTPPAGCTPATSPTLDDEGYCNIVGRIKDMVIRGGENIYPREIEEFLYRHPKIQDVQVLRRARPEVRRGALRLDHTASDGATPTRPRSAPSARARSRTTRSRATSASSTASR